MIKTTRKGSVSFFMKKAFVLLLVCMMTVAAVLVPCAGSASGEYYEEEPLLISMTHNCKNTGRMLPEFFDPYTTSYIFTVASWVSNPKFTLTASDPSYTITVDGQYVQQGVEYQVAKMDNNPKQVVIRVTAPSGAYKEYTFFLQRRPSERRTRVSAGYINSVYYQDNKWWIDADLVSVTYQNGGGNISTFSNKAQEHYKYACTADCFIYYGSMSNPVRMTNMGDFNNYADKTTLYRFVYIEDEIVGILPYEPDY